MYLLNTFNNNIEADDVRELLYDIAMVNGLDKIYVTNKNYLYFKLADRGDVLATYVEGEITRHTWNLTEQQVKTFMRVHDVDHIKFGVYPTSVMHEYAVESTVFFFQKKYTAKYMDGWKSHWCIYLANVYGNAKHLHDYSGVYDIARIVRDGKHLFNVERIGNCKQVTSVVSELFGSPEEDGVDL